VIASTFLSLQNWTPYIPSAATVKQIALNELYSQDWGLKGFSYFKGGETLGRFTLLFGQGKQKDILRCPPRNSYQEEPY
jgi:hypothetical protein